jgi:superfamily II DNA or RNA helicase
MPSGSNITDFHAKYLAYELTRRHASDSLEKLGAVLADAQVDLNPHQIDAALFAFRSPFSKGAILADEVGLGKTIEAGLLLAQKWAENERRLLVILPANLRKQWSQELGDKFWLPSTILETKSFNEAIKRGNLNPFQQESVVIASYQFIRNKEPYVRQTNWDLVVIDEAHRLRNVYKTRSKIAAAIKQAVAPFPKLLLTATPLQNSLLELYGLVSVIDDYAFGDLESFKLQFSRLGDGEDYASLKRRLEPILKRTLRRQVLEYVRYTNRHALVQEFVPTEEEQRLYDLMSEYLQRDRLYALPASQRQLVTLVLRKLLASSTYAIAGTLEGLVRRLDEAAAIADRVGEPPEEMTADWEELEELADEWEDEEDEASASRQPEALTPHELTELRSEADELRRFLALARQIVKNSKGEVLLTALRKGFARAEKYQRSEGASSFQQKAVIFTESRRTQDYLYRTLENTEFAGSVMLFNGSNTDDRSKEIYDRWLQKHAGTDRVSGSRTADKRAALVDHFRDEAKILIATEAAAEGINLQFCNLVVNYDLPWNPQRIEQRIGRCHRYGQKYDVVVVNFLNKANAADQRVYELLDEKFRLFDGVFGASDEVLGTVESGVDFEKRIGEIYQKCRSSEQITFEFEQLRLELDAEVSESERDARERLLDNFDQEVVEKVRLDSRDVLDRFNRQLWSVTKHVLFGDADFDDQTRSFMLRRNPFEAFAINPGPYLLGGIAEDANTYRAQHPLAQRVLERARSISVEPHEVRFDYSGSGKNIAAVEQLRGRSGWLQCSAFTVAALETEDQLILAAVTEEGLELEERQCRRLFELPGIQLAPAIVPPSVDARLNDQAEASQRDLLEQRALRQGKWFEVEMDKLDRWADDKRLSLKRELDELDGQLKEAKRLARFAPTLPEKLERQRALRHLESKRDDAWRAYDEARRDIDRHKDALLDDITRRLEESIETKHLFTIRWQVV